MGDATQVIQFKVYETLLNLPVGFFRRGRECLLDYIQNTFYVKF